MDGGVEERETCLKMDNEMMTPRLAFGPIRLAFGPIRFIPPHPGASLVRSTIASRFSPWRLPETLIDGASHPSVNAPDPRWHTPTARAETLLMLTNFVLTSAVQISKVHARTYHGRMRPLVHHVSPKHYTDEPRYFPQPVPWDKLQST